MPGPGGGPSRRSHTKSRKGCEACKRRHIRCDEHFPQCRNCTKHKITCPYNDLPAPEHRSVTPEKADLRWTPEIEAAINDWRATGIFPFPALNICPTPNSQVFSQESLRLIYHVASISQEMQVLAADEFTIWTRHIPKLLQIGATNDVVMQALLAFSAKHMASLTDCPLVGQMALDYRGVALQELQKAINFLPGSSDACFAASVVLSWTSTDWKDWFQIMQGTASVIGFIGNWEDSQFSDLIAQSSTFPTAPRSPGPDHKLNQPRKEDLEIFQKTCKELTKLEMHLKKSGEDTKLVSQLLNFVKAARKFSPALSVAQQFDRLVHLRNWLFWLPVQLLQQTRVSPNALVVIGHYHAVALLMERLFPEIGAAYIGGLSIGPVRAIATRLAVVGDVQMHHPFLQFPLQVVEEFQSRTGWIQPMPATTAFPPFDDPNFFSHQMSLTPPPTFIPYGDQTFTISAEDLSVYTTDSGPNSAVSLPMSPFASQQYLSIPSPSYGGGAYSPASSTFGEGSVVYSDTDDFVPFDMSMASSPVFPNAGSFDGFVTPLQTQAVWI